MRSLEREIVVPALSIWWGNIRQNVLVIPSPIFRPKRTGNPSIKISHLMKLL